MTCVGGDESSEFLRQNALLGERWRAPSPATSPCPAATISPWSTASPTRTSALFRARAADETRQMNEIPLQPALRRQRHPRCSRFARNIARAPTRESAVSLYYAVRDGSATTRSSTSPRTLYRAVGLPRAARRLVRVQGRAARRGRARGRDPGARGLRRREEPSSPRPELTAKMGTDLFVYHGLVELHLDGKVGQGERRCST
jgi:hypothetical protein